jgi:long-subunit acyl-CoA synthetase (AMP-forming)
MSLEKIKSNFVLIPEEFKVGEILTPTMKLQRKKAREFFQEEIDTIYKKSD